MEKIGFKGNGESTKDIAIAFNQLCEELEKLGELEVSYWALHLRGNKAMLKSRAKKCNDGKNFTRND